MKNRAGKGMKLKCRKIILFSVIELPLAFAGCKKDDPPIEHPKVKSMEQSVAVKEDVKIEYSAKLSNVDKAKLEVKKDGVLISTEQISDVTTTGADYQKTYSYTTDKQIKKGDYEFTLTSDNPSDNLKKDDYVTIPDYPASVSNINIDLNENSEIIRPLEFYDKNPEDHPVNAVSVESSQVQATLDGDNLKIKAPSNYYGPYQLKLKYGSSEGVLEEKTLQGNVIKDTRTIINPFISTDLNGAEYNSLTTKLDRDNFIQAKLNEDWVNTIPGSINPLWVCGNYELQLMTNSRDWGDKIKFTEWVFNNEYLYNGYKGNNLDSIYKNKGTLIDMGKLGLPINEVTLSIDSSLNIGHAMNWSATGDYLEKWEDLNFIEPQTDQINVQIGGWDIPENCDEVIINYYYPTKDKIKGNYLKYVTLLKFRIENGVPSLIWKNKDPNLNIIKQREK